MATHRLTVVVVIASDGRHIGEIARAQLIASQQAAAGKVGISHTYRVSACVQSIEAVIAADIRGSRRQHIDTRAV